MTIRTCKVHGNIRWRLTWQEGRKCNRKTFLTEQEAKNFAEGITKADSDFSRKFLCLSFTSQVLLAAILDDFDWDVSKLHAGLSKLNLLLAGKTSFSDLLAQFYAARRASGVSEDYLRIVNLYVEKFKDHLKPGTSLAEITERISLWLGDEGGLSRMGKLRRLKALSTVFNYAIQRGYCQHNPVLELLELLSRKRDPSPYGWVYIIAANGKFKVGMTTDSDIAGRTKYYGTAHPGPIQIKALIKTATPRKTERQLHRLFENQGKHIRNEWFALTDEDFRFLAQKFGDAYRQLRTIIASSRKQRHRVKNASQTEPPVAPLS